MRILLVEDELAIARAIARGLHAIGHEVDVATLGEDALSMMQQQPIELLILDLSLPRIDGFSVLEQVRAVSERLPVLVLTARDDIPSKVRAFSGGADDYLTKPFAFEELVARIGALARRAGEPTNQLSVGDLVLDRLSGRVRRGLTELDMTRREVALLEQFMLHPGEVLSRQYLLANVWGYDFDPGSNVVDVYVRYLRRKIDQPGEPSLIATVRGDGYRLEPQQRR
jgi:DNA-binding response OmpR family regulator